MRVMMSKEDYTPWDASEVLAGVNEDGIIEYLIDALEENDPEFFARAMGDVARAKGMTNIAQETHLGRSSLYKALLGERDPKFGTVMKVLAALDIQLTVAPKRLPAA